MKRFAAWCGLAAACAAGPGKPAVVALPAPVIELAPPAAPTRAAAVPSGPPIDTPGVFAALALLPKAAQHYTPGAVAQSFGVTLKKRWATKVGLTTFRTTMAFVDGAIVIGTHGDTLNGLNEKSDGVYLLDAATGRRKAFFPTPGAGDLDIGGVAVLGDRIYFSSDDGLCGAFGWDGKLLWKQALGGKVRPAPALGDFDGDGAIDVVCGDEQGLLAAFDGGSGKKLWSHQTGANDYGSKGYIGAPAIVARKGVGDDVIAGARDGVLERLRGSDGAPLWAIKRGSGIHASPALADLDGDGRPELLLAWSYGDLLVIDPEDGRAKWGAELAQDDGGIEGLFGSPVPLPAHPGAIVQGTSWWGKQDGIIGVGPALREFKSQEGRVSATAVVIDLDGDGSGEALIGTEDGKLLAISATGGRQVLATLGARIEAPALLADVDGDGAIEVLVASGDGMLSCFDTGVRRAPILSRFRGDDAGSIAGRRSAQNRGDYHAMPLDWRAPKMPPPLPRDDLTACCAAIDAMAGLTLADRKAAFIAAGAACRALAAERVPRDQARASLEKLLGRVPAACR